MGDTVLVMNSVTSSTVLGDCPALGTVGVSIDGVDFKSLDGEKVHLFFLLISPPDRPGDHLRALENISRQLRDDTFCRFLKQSKTAEDIWQLLEEADNNQFVS